MELNYRQIAIGLGIALFLAAFRYRFVSVHKTIANAIMVGGIAVVALAVLWPSKIASVISVSGNCRYQISNGQPKSELQFFQIIDLTARLGGHGLGQAGGFPFGTHGVECTITNDSDAPIFNVSIPLELKFVEAVPVEGQNNAWKHGVDIATQKWLVPIDRLPGNGATFSFFATNETDYFVHVDLPKTVSLVENGKPEVADLIQPAEKRVTDILPKKAIRR
jgi:hypothetical protein